MCVTPSPGLAFVFGLVAVVCIVGVTRLGSNVNDVFCAINNAIAAVPALAAVGAVGGC